MDQNYQFTQGFSGGPEPAPVEKNAKYYRGQAWSRLRGNWLNLSVSYFLQELLLGLGMMIVMIPMILVIVAVVAAVGSVNNPEFTGGPLLLMLLGLYVLMFASAFLIGGPLHVSLTRMHLDAIDGKPVMIGDLFWGFKKCFGRSAGLFTLYTLIPAAIIAPVGLICGVIMGVASAVIPSEPLAFALISIMAIVLVAVSVTVGIVVTYRYALCFFIMAEYPEIRAVDALRNSARLMKGKKWNLFCLQFSFIGWVLLMVPATIITCGMGSILAYPLSAYMTTATAAFYDDAANRQAAREVEFPSLNPDDYDPNGSAF